MSEEELTYLFITTNETKPTKNIKKSEIEKRGNINAMSMTGFSY